MESPEVMIARAARRATVKWRAGEDLRRKLESHGADPKTVLKYAEKLAEALRS